MIKQTFDGRQRTGCYISPYFNTLHDVRCMTNGSCKYLCSITVISIHFYNLAYQCNTVFSDVIQTPYKRRNISSSCLGSQQCLSYGKY